MLYEFSLPTKSDKVPTGAEMARSGGPRTYHPAAPFAARERKGDGLRSAFVGLWLVTGFYLMTGIVYEGFGMQLVVKPYPSLTLFVGEGEEGTWQREHPNESKPWWLVGDFVPLVIDDWEGGHPRWEEAYSLGFLATLLSWLALGGLCVFRHVLRRRIDS